MTNQNILSFDGYTYNTETREVTFQIRKCWNCKGKGEIVNGILCPRYGRKVNHLAGRKCKHCGAKNRDSHKSIDEKMVKCYTCDGHGEYMPDSYDSFNMSALVDFIEIVMYDAKLRQASFNEQYLGMGIIGGVTDYGQYLDESKGDMQIILGIVNQSMKERHRHSQALNLVGKDGRLIERGLLKLCPDGWHVYSMKAQASIGELK